MGSKILVVDDEADMVSMLELRLSANGFTVVSACDGLDGLAKVKKEKPDLVISDVLMPKMDGFAFYKALKSNPETAKIPVLILTARGKMEDTFRVMGADHFITKPFDAQQLVTKVFVMLGQVPGTTVAPKPPAEQPKEAVVPPAETVPVVPGKKIFILASSENALTKLGDLLKNKNCQLMLDKAGPKSYDHLVSFKPEILILDVIVGGKSASEMIMKLRKSSEFRNLPILTFSFIDKGGLGTTTFAEKTMEVDKARNACLAAGCTEAMRGVEEEVLNKFVDRYFAA